MKICFSTLVCPQWGLSRILDAASENGIPGIDFRGIGQEMDLTTLPEFTAELGATLAEMRGRNLQMPCLNTSVRTVVGAPDQWPAMLEECRRYAELASRTNTPYLRIFGGGSSKLSPDEARQMAQRHLRQLIKICKPHNCQVVLETHDNWCTSRQLLEVIHEFQPDEVGVLWDVEHPLRHEESLQETSDGLKGYLKHVHIKDSVRTAGAAKSSPTLLGEGELPVVEFLQVLRQRGYEGWICLETEKRWRPEAPEPEESVPQFARFMREHWSAR